MTILKDIPTPIKKCDFCGENYSQKNKTQKYCYVSCRTLAEYARKKTGDNIETKTCQNAASSLILPPTTRDTAPANAKIREQTSAPQRGS